MLSTTLYCDFKRLFVTPYSLTLCNTHTCVCLQYAHVCARIYAHGGPIPRFCDGLYVRFFRDCCVCVCDAFLSPTQTLVRVLRSIFDRWACVCVRFFMCTRLHLFIFCFIKEKVVFFFRGSNFFLVENRERFLATSGNRAASRHCCHFGSS